MSPMLITTINAMHLLTGDGIPDFGKCDRLQLVSTIPIDITASREDLVGLLVDTLQPDTWQRLAEYGIFEYDVTTAISSCVYQMDHRDVFTDPRFPESLVWIILSW